MAKSIADKFKIKPGDRLMPLQAPESFAASIGPLPGTAEIVKRGNKINQIHWFVQNQAGLKKGLSQVMRLLSPGMILWIYYPKGRSKMQTDLTRDKGWDCLDAEKDNLTWLTLVSFDENWSAFGFRAKTQADQRKEAKPKEEREIFKWADSATKTIILPPELSAAFRKHKKEANYFHSLAFSHRREYVEWIISAKKEDTRLKRLEGTLEKLRNKWKNPRNE